jgi:glutamate synthase domain-containing protein 3
MTGGTVVVLGPVGANFGAGMTGGRAYLYDPSGRHLAALDTASVRGVRLSLALEDREDGPARLVEVLRLLEAHRDAGSARAARILASGDVAAEFWLVEPVVQAPATDASTTSAEPQARAPQLDRNSAVPRPLPTPAAPAPTLGP